MSLLGGIFQYQFKTLCSQPIDQTNTKIYKNKSDRKPLLQQIAMNTSNQK
jgi:hypothetical protein